MRKSLDPKKRSPVVAVVTAVCLGLLTPLTILFFGLFARQSYYLASLLIVVYTMVPFFVAFEHRRPQARELVVVSVMAAICIGARAAFFWLPQFKPLAALVMIGGIALGAQSGFLIGALSMFVSNFIFGQGPWTPFQMFGFGLVGFIAGFLADRGILARVSLSCPALWGLSLCAGLLVLFVLGPILDTTTLLTMISTITVESALAVYLSGMAFNLMQAIATFITFLLAANGLLKIFQRVRQKYGLLQ